jgi:Ca2+-binding RTX toxin-like protein
VTGGGGNDTLRGNAGDDVLSGLGGDDQLFGGFIGSGSKMGSDTLYGGDGNDALYAEGGSVGYGGAGQDTLSGRNGGNALYGGADNDSLTTRGGDQLFGDAGDDRLVVTDAGGAEIHGGAGNDTLVVDVSASYPGSSQLYGDDGDDVLTGDTTQERLDGGRGTDEMRGGLGDDTYVVDRPQDVIIEAANEGADTVEIRYSHILGANFENLLLMGDANGWGNAAANVLTGNDGANRLNGLGGADTLIGGKGDDIYVVNNPGDQIVESSAQGSDTVLSSIDYSLGNAVEHLTLLGSADRTATGNTGANRLTGNSGDNLITGNGGADVLKGNLGADIFRYFAISDSSTSGIDRIDDFALAQGDVVDISAIDANEGQVGDQAFNQEVGAGAAFSAAGQYRFSAVSGGFLAEFNVDADTDAEFAIRFLGATTPEAGWFLL